MKLGSSEGEVREPVGPQRVLSAGRVLHWTRASLLGLKP